MEEYEAVNEVHRSLYEGLPKDTVIQLWPEPGDNWSVVVEAGDVNAIGQALGLKDFDEWDVKRELVKRAEQKYAELEDQIVR